LEAAVQVDVVAAIQVQVKATADITHLLPLTLKQRKMLRAEVEA
jgi:hypothetical protein